MRVGELPSRIRELVEKAARAREQAYAPYSQFGVGAALLAANGDVYTGCNIENASFPAGLCAERAALASAVTAGARQFEAIAVVASWLDSHPVTPCGVCRQALIEFGPDILVIAASGRTADSPCACWRLGDLLPQAFSLK